MIPSTNEYNLHPAHGILLDGTAIDYRQSDPLQSIRYIGFSYHYEFWIHSNGNLYACIHCTHKKPNINLVRFINGLFPLISGRLTTHGFIGIINVPLSGLSGVGSKINTHAINIECRKHGAGYTARNANLMWHLIDVTHGII